MEILLHLLNNILEVLMQALEVIGVGSKLLLIEVLTPKLLGLYVELKTLSLAESGAGEFLA